MPTSYRYEGVLRSSRKVRGERVEVNPAVRDNALRQPLPAFRRAVYPNATVARIQGGMLNLDVRYGFYIG